MPGGNIKILPGPGSNRGDFLVPFTSPCLGKAQTGSNPRHSQTDKRRTWVSPCSVGARLPLHGSLQSSGGRRRFPGRLRSLLRSKGCPGPNLLSGGREESINANIAASFNGFLRTWAPVSRSTTDFPFFPLPSAYVCIYVVMSLKILHPVPPPHTNTPPLATVGSRCSRDDPSAYTAQANSCPPVPPCLLPGGSSWDCTSCFGFPQIQAPAEYAPPPTCPPQGNLAPNWFHKSRFSVPSAP